MDIGQQLLLNEWIQLYQKITQRLRDWNINIYVSA